MSKWLTKLELEGELVKLTPLRIEHTEELAQAVKDGALWELWYTSAPKPEEVESYIRRAIAEFEEDVSLPFAVLHKSSGRIIGTSRFTSASQKNRRIEIGFTWYAWSMQRSGVNTECKYLLLKHAFETLDCIAVEFRTHWHNVRSRAAIARLGAKQDGILRNHQIDHNGIIRDTVVFSILDHEWETVKYSLEHKLRRSY